MPSDKTNQSPAELSPASLAESNRIDLLRDEMTASSENLLSQARHSINLRLKLLFAAISGMGGLVLASGTEGSALSIFAVFFAIFGFVFVDWLEFFALPAVAAYAAMGVAAMFCVGDFLELNAPGQHQIGVVAQLLVFVQSILMLQRKSRRIFEQLGVFCLLELIVAAVFNDALLFGVLLLPIALIGSIALSIIAAKWVTEGTMETTTRGNQRPLLPRNTVLVDSTESWNSVLTAAPRLSRAILMMLAPAVLLISLIFFYALPRTTDAARVQSRGKAMVGFSDELRLGQIGQMMQSTQPALRVHLRERETGEAYQVIGGLYLRGKVMERYEEFNHLTGTGASWKSLPAGYLSEPQRLPDEYVSEDRSDIAYYDSVDVKVVCESMRSDALFAIAPYYGTEALSRVMHFAELWTIGREGKADWIYPRVEYRFGSNAFRAGIQSELLSVQQRGDPFYRGMSVAGTRAGVNVADDQRRSQEYIEQLLVFSERTMPTIEQLASEFTNDTDDHRRSDYAIAKAMERHFSEQGKYQYTLNLDAESVPGLDPIEQFIRIDQRGHCQYFASALAMMLRSQGIPARVVAGYHTDEYNELARHFVARQLHAHAWVEALIEVKPGDGTPTAFGQPEANRYWLRLDPTPPAGRVREASQVGQALDLAQTVWDDYVIEMDGERQQSRLLNGGSNSMNQSYRQFIDRLGLLVSRIRAGQLGGGAFASRDWFSWQAALIAFVGFFLFAGLLRIRLIKRQRTNQKTNALVSNAPSLQFYAEALKILEQLSIQPSPGQTPKEFSGVAGEKLTGPESATAMNALHFLTDRFYAARFGGQRVQDGLATIPQIVDSSHQGENRPSEISTPKAASIEHRINLALSELKKGVAAVVQLDKERNRAR